VPLSPFTNPTTSISAKHAEVATGSVTFHRNTQRNEYKRAGFVAVTAATMEQFCRLGCSDVYCDVSREKCNQQSMQARLSASFLFVSYS
jgi:hypothetical protein